ncbi:MAG TPA: ABC transporter permease [Candidatus Fraserbacteria bacterium]|nr:ABC transporter permease [Candidatus Fraserbacteria bacterium]
MDIKLAWRNVWRNRRRSVIIISAIAIGLAGVVVYEALTVGMTTQMVENIVGTSLGDIEIHHRGFQESKTLELAIDNPEQVLRLVRGTEHVSAAAPRVRAQGLVSSARASAGVQILGVDPTAEPAVSTIAHSLVRGRFLAAADEYAIYLGEALAKKLKVGLGRKVVLMAKGLAPGMASNAFRVVGTFQTASPNFDKMTVYIPLAAAQSLLSLEGKISEIAVRIDRQRSLEQVAATLRTKLAPNEYEVLTWKELVPNLVQMTQLWEEWVYLFAFVIYIAMVFGVTNTMLMVISERTRELGIMLALGTRPLRIFRMILIESALMGLVSVALGSAASFGVVWWLSLQGLDLGWFVRGLSFLGLSRIIYPVLTPSILLISGLSALVATVLAAIWPAWRAVRLEPVEAIRDA